MVALPVGAALLAGSALAAAHHGGPTVPQRYRPVVVRAAASCPGLSPRVLAAQIQQESGWDSGATSACGAEGIAQFLPSVWAQYGVDGDGDGVKDVWDPADAIPAAARLDCRLLAAVARVPGDRVSNMLAAYDAGLERVRRYAGVPPFPETMAYVRAVLARAEQLTVVPASS
jgi:soluble lytic murein transglycosylase-like protein